MASPSAPFLGSPVTDTFPGMSASSHRRMLSCGVLALLGLLAITAYHVSAFRPGEETAALGNPEPAPPPAPAPADEKAPPQVESAVHGADWRPEAGSGEIGKFFHIDLSANATREPGIAGCQYPVLVHVTPDAHCTGALALYASIVRNVLREPALQGTTCVHFTYVDPDLALISDMLAWPARANPFAHVADCAALTAQPALNALVPVRFQALVPMPKPEIMHADRPNWLVALNKVHSWGFDAYPRILLMDADSMVTADLHRIFDEPSMDYTVLGAADQFWNCRDRGRINGGMILLRPSRYFHIAALERLFDPEASCQTGNWGFSEQELLNCICGTVGEGRGAISEFACQIMPLYNSLWPRNYGCSAANVVPFRSIHFAAVKKPWNVADNELGDTFDYRFWGCVRDAGRAGDPEALKACHIPPLEETRTVAARPER